LSVESRKGGLGIMGENNQTAKNSIEKSAFKTQSTRWKNPPGVLSF